MRLDVLFPQALYMVWVLACLLFNEKKTHSIVNAAAFVFVVVFVIGESLCAFSGLYFFFESDLYLQCVGFFD